LLKVVTAVTVVTEFPEVHRTAAVVAAAIPAPGSAAAVAPAVEVLVQIQTLPGAPQKMGTAVFPAAADPFASVERLAPAV